MNFGEFIAARRKLKQLTQEELAEKIHVSKSAVAKWETNGGLPARDNLQRLAEVIGVSVDEMHRVIKQGITDQDIRAVNITADVIEVLESYGYEVRGPEGRR